MVRFVLDARGLIATKGIPVDVCKVFGEDTVFLQQAAHLTAGVYLRLEHSAGLLQYLMVSPCPN